MSLLTRLLLLLRRVDLQSAHHSHLHTAGYNDNTAIYRQTHATKPHIGHKPHSDKPSP